MPTGEWHEITNGSNEEMIAVQITKLMLEQNTEDRYIGTTSTLISILLYKLYLKYKKSLLKDSFYIYKFINFYHKSRKIFG